MSISLEEFQEWVVLQEQLVYIKEREMNLRKRICEEQLAVNSVGTKKFQLYGATLKATQTESISVDETVLSQHWDSLTDAEKECVKYKPSIDKKKYDALQEDSTLRLHVCTRRVNAPTLKKVV